MKNILKWVLIAVVALPCMYVGSNLVLWAWDTEHNLWVDENPHVRACKHADTCNGGIYRAGRWDYITGDYGHPNPNWKGGK